MGKRMPDKQVYTFVKINVSFFRFGRVSRPRTRVRDLPGAASGIQNVQGSYGVLPNCGKGIECL